MSLALINRRETEALVGSVNISAWFVLKYHWIQCRWSRPTTHLHFMSRSTIMQLCILMDSWVDRQTVPWVYGHKEGVLLKDQFYTFFITWGEFLLSYTLFQFMYFTIPYQLLKWHTVDCGKVRWLWMMNCDKRGRILLAFLTYYEPHFAECSMVMALLYSHDYY